MIKTSPPPAKKYSIIINPKKKWKFVLKCVKMDDRRKEKKHKNKKKNVKD